MRYVLTALSFLFIGCATQEAPRFSSTHQWLKDFEKEYIQAMRAAPNEIKKEELKEDYRQKLNAYLVGMKQYRIDSVTVKVRRIRALYSGFVSAEFEGAGVVFYNDLQAGEPGFDVVRSLREGQDTTIGFKYLGEIQLKDPGTYQPVRIEAIPVN